MFLRFLAETWGLTLEMAPYLWIGFLAAGMIRIWLKPEIAKKYLAGRGFRKNVQATLIGIPLPVCSCGIVPIAAGLRRAGAGPGPTLSFMTATPQTGVDSILATWGMMGPFFAIFRMITAFVSGVVTGVFVDWLAPHHPTDLNISSNRKNEENADPGKDAGADAETAVVHEPLSGMSKLKSGLRYAFLDLPEDIGKSILIGLTLSGLFTTLVPANFFEAYMGHPLLTYLAVTLFAVPLYVCSTGSIPLALALVKSGVSPGAALVFLIAGPATNTVTLSAIWKLLGPKRLGLYLLSLILVAWGAGYGLDTWAPDTWAPIDSSDHEHTHSAAENGFGVVQWIQWIAALALVIFVARPWVMPWTTRMIARFRKSSDSENGVTLEPDEKWRAWTFEVQGITCGNCAKKIQNHLAAQPWMKQIAAYPDKGVVQLETRIKYPIPVLKKLLNEIGFEIVSGNADS